MLRSNDYTTDATMAGQLGSGILNASSSPLANHNERSVGWSQTYIVAYVFSPEMTQLNFSRILNSIDDAVVSALLLFNPLSAATSTYYFKLDCSAYTGFAQQALCPSSSCDSLYATGVHASHRYGFVCLSP